MTASEAPGPTGAACWGSGTGLPSSTASFGSRAQSTAARSSPQRSRSPARPRQPRGGAKFVAAAEQAETRYSNGGDEWMLVQLAEGMSVGVNMRALAICRRLEEQRLDGVLDVCPSNASYLVRLDPDVLHPRALEERLRELEAEVGDAADFHLVTRVVDVPILWDDPWTHEVVQRFHDRHQTPDLTDIEFAAQLNGFESPEAFRDAVFGVPFLVTMIGFVPGLTWGYQLVAAERQIEVPSTCGPAPIRPSSPSRGAARSRPSTRSAARAA